MNISRVLIWEQEWVTDQQWRTKSVLLLIKLQRKESSISDGKYTAASMIFMVNVVSVLFYTDPYVSF